MHRGNKICHRKTEFSRSKFELFLVRFVVEREREYGIRIFIIIDIAIVILIQ